MPRERRVHDRFPVAYRLKARLLEPLVPGEEGSRTPQEIQGEVPNIGAGGLCLVTDQAPELAAPLRCEILVPLIRVGIPTLVQVRWTDWDSDGRKYRMGLQYVI